MQRVLTSSRRGKEGQLINYFASYLNDMVGCIQQVRQMVYELIQINCPLRKQKSVSPQIHSIVLTYLRKIQILLKGYLKGNKHSHQQFNLQRYRTQQNFSKKDNSYQPAANKTYSTKESFTYVDNLQYKIMPQKDSLKASSSQKQLTKEGNQVPQIPALIDQTPSFKKMNNCKSQGNFLPLKSKLFRSDTEMGESQLTALQIVRKLREQLFKN